MKMFYNKKHNILLISTTFNENSNYLFFFQ